ncbi:dienelactone hydrolase family protein [Zunongwangia sp. F363]|uniref:Dienelactone hydrolase family protein n=1 Tax=Autumnicola tepida TaxID=3075595 RepID=A0ABU3CE96_9FLAO|nr:dienelactone hydrolase family protein [Zunongwangia sp. F363]MDT0644676.1 dienelactone hydrolase family protein [Zunongwangia sp. F363]
MHEYNIVEKGTAPGKAKKAIILLHGRGASAEDILQLAQYFPGEDTYLAAPQATNHTWYPTSFIAPEEENEPWLSSAVEVVKRLIDETAQHIPLNKIYLMGFSQGACLCLEVAARFANRYAGIVAFTGGLVGEKLKPERYNGNFEGTKIFIGTGDKDAHVPLARVKESVEILKKSGAAVHLEVYKDRPHTIISDEIEKAKRLLFS